MIETRVFHWPAPTFTYQGTAYNLTHLHGKPFVYVRPAEGKNPERKYNVDITYSMHCFTRDPAPGECPDVALLCWDGRETRVFDCYRWELSAGLPAIVENLMKQKCFHTGHANYFTQELVTKGTVVKYEIFFTVTKSSKKGRLNLFIQTAFARTKPVPKQRHTPPIRFYFILHNTLQNLPIKAPK